MGFLSLINDLGIIPNEGSGVENDPAMQQGQQFMEYSRMYTANVQPHLVNLQGQHTMQGQANVGSITDALQSGISAGSRKNHTFSSGGSVSQTHSKFERTLAKYTSLHKTYSEEILNQNIRINDSLIRNVDLATSSEKMDRIKSMNLKLQDLTRELLAEIDDTVSDNSSQQLLPQKSTLKNYLLNFQEEHDQLNNKNLNTSSVSSVGQPSAAARQWFIFLIFIVFMLIIYYILADRNIMTFAMLLCMLIVFCIVSKNNI